MTTPIYGLTEWAAAQASPWVPHNAALRLSEALIRGVVADRDLTSPPSSCDDGDSYLIGVSATGAWSGHDGEFAVAVGGDAENGWLFALVESDGTQLWVIDEGVRIQYFASVPGWVEVSSGGGGTVPFSVGGFFTTTPEASEVLLRYTFTEAIQFADDFAGSDGNVATNPASSFVLSIGRNGSAIGSITISTAGAFTFATTGTGTEAFAVGDELTITGPSVADTTIANASYTLKGQRA